MINTLYLSYGGLSDPLGQSQIQPYILGLSKNNNLKIISFKKIKILIKPGFNKEQT